MRVRGSSWQFALISKSECVVDVVAVRNDKTVHVMPPVAEDYSRTWRNAHYDMISFVLRIIDEDGVEKGRTCNIMVLYSYF